MTKAGWRRGQLDILGVGATLTVWTTGPRFDSDGMTDFNAGLAAALDSFLSQRGLSRNEVANEDLRVDLVYLGPGKGRCARRLMIRSAPLVR